MKWYPVLRLPFPPVLPSGFSRLLVIATAAVGMLCTPVQASLLGDYHFQGDFGNSVPGLGSLNRVQKGANATDGFSPQGWEWNNVAPSQVGLSVEFPNPAAFSSYSVGMVLQVSQVSSYAKLMDFSNLSSDTGIYAYSGGITVYTGSGHHGGNIAPDTTFSLVVTRAADQTLNVYLNGNSTPIITVLDATSQFALGSELFFLLDDRDGSEISPAGILSQIRIWDTALSPGEIPHAFAPVPEPSTYGIVMAAGLAVLAWARSRRRAA